MDPNNTKPDIQKKLFVYARDFALDKLNKKIEKQMAKQQMRQSSSHKIFTDVHNQRSSLGDDLCRTSPASPSSSSPTKQSLQSNEKLAVKPTAEETNGNYSTHRLSKIVNNNVGQSVSSVNSSGQDDDYETADEDDESPLSPDAKQSDKKLNQTTGKPNIDDFIVEIVDDKNDKLVSSSQGQVHGSHHPHGSSPVDYSGYIQKKSLAQGMMDLALVSANTNQLRYIIEYKDHHPYFMTSLSLVIASLFLQLAVGMTLIWNTRFNVKKRSEMREADKVNNFSVIAIFVVTLINVFLSTFGGAPQSGSSINIDASEMMITSDSTVSTDAATMTTEANIYF